MQEKLKEFRIGQDLSQEKIAQELGISTSFYLKIETGIKNPSYNFLTKLKQAFPEIDINEIFF